MEYSTSVMSMLVEEFRRIVKIFLELPTNLKAEIILHGYVEEMSQIMNQPQILV